MAELEDPLYKDWLRAALSLKYLKEGIYGFVDQFAKQHHSNLLQSYIKGTGSPANSCTECSSENLMPDHPRHQCIQKFRSKCFCNNPVGRRKCPNNFCSRLYDLIVIAHDERNPLWINTDPRKWYMDHWEIAKCYLSTTGHSEKGIASDTDAAGLLSIIVNNIEIRNYVSCIDNIRKVRAIRNAIMHSKSFQVDQSSLYQYIDQMILVLQDPKILFTDIAAQNAVIKLEKLKRDQIYISLEDAYEMRRQTLKAGEDGVKKIEETKDEAIQQIETKKNITHDYLDSHFDQRLLEQNKKIEALTIRMQTEKNEFESKYQTAVNEIDTKRRQITDNIDAYFESRVNDHENKLKEQSKEISDVETVNSDLTEDEKGLQRYLLELYRKEYVRIHISPLSTKKRENVEELYVPLQAKIFSKHKNEAATKLADVFQQDNKVMHSIYLTGEAGIGKSTFCRKLISLWCTVRENDGQLPHDYTPVFDFETQSSTENTAVQIFDEFDNNMDDLYYEYESDSYSDDSSLCDQDLSTDTTENAFPSFTSNQNRVNLVAIKSQINESVKDNASIQKFYFLFFISLRDTAEEGSIEAMVENQLLFQKSEYVECFKSTIDRIPEKCLFILDGLDEWTQPKPHPTHPTVTRGLPLSKANGKYVKLFTTRRWKYESLSPCIEEHESELILRGIGKTASKTVIEKMLVSKYQILKFEKAACISDTYDLWTIPLLLKLLICVWKENSKLERSKTELYSSIINIMLHLAEKRNDLNIGILNYQLPQMLEVFRYIKDNSNFIVKLAQFAFYSLFEEPYGSSVVFSEFYILKQGLSSREILQFLKTGILTQKSISSQFTFILNTSLSFIHKSFQEYFAAVYIAFAYSDKKELRKLIVCRCSTTYEILEMANVLHFLADLRQDLYQDLLKEIAPHYRGISLGNELDLKVKLDSCLIDIFLRGDPKSVFIESINYGLKGNLFSNRNQQLQFLELDRVSMTLNEFKRLLESIPMSGTGVDVTLICIGWIDEYYEIEAFQVRVQNVRKLKIKFTNLNKVEFMLPQNICSVELMENDMTVSGLNKMINSVSETEIKGEIELTLQRINLLSKSKEDLNRELLIDVRNIRKLKIQSTNLTEIEWKLFRNIRTVELIDTTLSFGTLSAMIDCFLDTEIELDLNYSNFSNLKYRIFKLLLNRSQITNHMTLGTTMISTESLSKRNIGKFQICLLHELWIIDTNLSYLSFSSKEFDIINFVDVTIGIKGLKKILGKKMIGHLCTVLGRFKQDDIVTFTGSNTDEVLISDRFNLRHQKSDTPLEISVNDNKVVSVLTISNRLKNLNPAHKDLYLWRISGLAPEYENNLSEILKFIPPIEQMKLNLHFENITYLSTDNFECLVEKLRTSAFKIFSVTMDNDEGDIHVKDRVTYVYDTLKPESVQGIGRPVLA